MFDVDDLLKIRQKWKKKGTKIVKKKTFGMKMLERNLAGATIDMGWIHAQHRAAKEDGTWNWHHAGHEARSKAGTERVSVSLRQSKPIKQETLNIEDFLPAYVDPHLEERLNLSITVMKELKSGASTCDWTKYDRTGAYSCSNARLWKDSKFCAFHTPHCVLVDKHDKPERIKNPNNCALCDDCHIDRFHKMPPKLKLGIPGV